MAQCTLCSADVSSPLSANDLAICKTIGLSPNGCNCDKCGAAICLKCNMKLLSEATTAYLRSGKHPTAQDMPSVVKHVGCGGAFR